MKFDKSYYDSYTQSKERVDWFSAKSRRQYYYDSIVRKIYRHSDPHIVVEIGCGMGFLSDTLGRSKNSPQIYCGDISKYAVEVVSSNVGLSNVHPQLLDAHKLNFENNFCDVLLAFDVIEHLPDPGKFASEALRILKPGGILFLSTPNEGSFGNKLKGHHNRESFKHYLDRKWEWHGNRDDSHINIKSIENWRELLSSFNLVSDGTDYLWDTPYFKCLPVLLQKVLFNGAHQILTRVSLFMPWGLGENYYGIWRKPL